MSENGLIIFIKNPELGKVKTRLAKDVGEEKALQIYKALLAHTRKVSLQVSANRYLFYHEQIKNDEWLEEDFKKRLQHEGDLGEKMSDAFDQVLHYHNKAIIIGSDCPQISSTIINEAYTYVDDHDLVIGATYDGGYYLLGMKVLNTDIFKGIEWSTDKVFDQTIAKVKKNGLSFHKLPKLSDVDYIEDWNNYGWEL